MYEQQGTSTTRRILLVALSIIVVTIVAWLSIWLVFFRGKDGSDDRTSKNITTQTKQDAGDDSKKTQSDKDTAKPAQTPSVSNQNITASDQAGRLANSGPGEVIVPVLAGFTIGAIGYQLYIRKKAVQ